MITDGELLEACRSAGLPGSPSHREACRLYRVALAEWLERDRAWKEAAEAACQLPGCGTRDGYREHRKMRTRTCRACRKAWAAYVSERKAERERRRLAVTSAAVRREQAVRALRESPAFTAHLAGELVLGRAA